MTDNFKENIGAQVVDIESLLSKKFYIDNFQREYNWENKHIAALITDLTSTFLNSYTFGNSSKSFPVHKKYYLGPMVFSINPEDGKSSIIDGQQRITSIILFLIYLNNLQMNAEDKVDIEKLIISKLHKKISFNLSDEQREPCLNALFKDEEYIKNGNENETIINILDRYDHINSCFPDELRGDALYDFIEWLIYKVTIVQIIAYSDDNAYTIFQSMNDRGLSLTPTELLKGYVLSKISDPKKKGEINEIWKEMIQELHSRVGKYSDLDFFRAWFRSKYAITIRQGKAKAENMDFEIIATQFHDWFSKKHDKVFQLKTSDDFYNFFKKDFPFFVKWYLAIFEAKSNYKHETRHVYYINSVMGIASSLDEPLLLSPINIDDEDKVIYKKLDWVARYIETLTTRRAVHGKQSRQTTLVYSIYTLVKELRNKNLIELAPVLKKSIDKMDYQWEGTHHFTYNYRTNRKIVKHLLARISGYLDDLVEAPTKYKDYHDPDGLPYQIEHLWADKFSRHSDEFDTVEEFQEYRNKIGGLVLIQEKKNQSLGDLSYEDKLDHYAAQNTYAKTLHPICYKNEPAFSKSLEIQRLGFKSYPTLTKDNIVERSQLVQRICEQLWSTEYFTE